MIIRQRFRLFASQSMGAVSVKKLANYQGHNDAIFALAQSQDSAKFYSSGADGMVSCWQLDEPDGHLVAQVPNSVYAMAETGNRKLLVGHNYDGLHVIDPDEKQELGTIQLTSKQLFSIISDGNDAWCGTGDGELIRLDWTNLQILQRQIYTDKSLRTIAMRPDGKELALGFSDHYIRIVDPNSLELLLEYKAHENSVFSLLYNGRHLISGGRDAHIRVWDIDQGYEPYKAIPAHNWAINDAALSPDGQHFVTCSMDKTIKVWDATTYDLLKVIDKERHDSHTSSVNKILWTNDAVISVSDDRRAMAWNIDFESADI